MQRAKELVFTTRFVGAEEAERLQLVSRVVPADSLDAEAMKFAAELAEQPTFALAMAKKLFDYALGPSFEDFLDYELMVQPQLNQSADYREGFTSFQEKRPARFTGR
ncbi:hypothetical protein AXW67_12360 [Bradyrhizobium neotropicale]|uniref:Enoyl-CoA hydratase n=2 Tax=Bradyrhizobium neotropicale TaxID=1497615 RepID=A0A176Z9D1_9BRAD|nr:hypothetical protein AXW67_12360 [Bradyrhizobium neotropicale]